MEVLFFILIVLADKTLYLIYMGIDAYRFNAAVSKRNTVITAIHSLLKAFMQTYTPHPRECQTGTLFLELFPDSRLKTPTDQILLQEILRTYRQYPLFYLQD